MWPGWSSYSSLSLCGNQVVEMCLCGFVRVRCSNACGCARLCVPVRLCASARVWGSMCRVCLGAHARVCALACGDARDSRVYARVGVRARLHVCTSTFTRVCVRMRVCTCMCVSEVCVCVCVCVSGRSSSTVEAALRARLETSLHSKEMRRWQRTAFQAR